MVYADLHVHTDNSDGRLSLEAVPAAAREAGVSVVAITDHDRPHPSLDAPIVERGDLTIVHGIELRVEAASQRVDLLGYGIEETPALQQETERLAADRLQRGRKIKRCLEAELGVELDLTVDEGTGRPHLARAVVAHPETEYDSLKPVFLDLIGDGRECFVSRDVPSFERGVELLDEAARVVGLAHPFRYEDPSDALALCSDLDAVERYYPYDRPLTGETTVDMDLLAAVIEEQDLLQTGGSDSHTMEIGRTGLDQEAYGPVRAALLPHS